VELLLSNENGGMEADGAFERAKDPALACGEDKGTRKTFSLSKGPATRPVSDSAELLHLEAMASKLSVGA
jgi:hypothetical protein